jgi:hypothetical protein
LDRLERIVPQTRQDPHKRLRPPAKITHGLPKLWSESDLVAIVQLGNTNSVVVAMDLHLSRCESAGITSSASKPVNLVQESPIHSTPDSGPGIVFNDRRAFD